MDIVINYIPTERQEFAHKQPHRYKLFGGAMGGGKSVWLVMEVLRLMITYPGNKAVMARYHASDFKNTTLVTLFKMWPSELISEHNKTEKTIRLINGSEVLYMGLSEEEDISKFKSMEFGVFAFDEASEIPKEQFDLACTRLGRWVLKDKTKRPPFYGLLTSNPEDCWLKDYFVDGKGGKDFCFIPSLPKDNKYLPKNYSSYFSNMSTEWFNKYWEGSWDDIATGNFVFDKAKVKDSVNKEVEFERKPCMGIDVGRGKGGDESVIYVGMGRRVVDSYFSSIDSTDMLALRAQRLYYQYDVQASCIDDIGVGAGVTDFMSNFSKCEGVEGINVAKKSEDERFFNLKAEIYWYVREQFEAGKICLPDDALLVRQLTAIKYIMTSKGKIAIEKKEETKKRLGASPDRADAFVLMIWASRNLVDLADDYDRGNFDQDGVGVINIGRYDSYGWNNIR